MFKLYVASVNLSLWVGQSRDKQTIVKYIEKGPRQKWDNAQKKEGVVVLQESLKSSSTLFMERKEKQTIRTSFLIQTKKNCKWQTIWLP